MKYAAVLSLVLLSGCVSPVEKFCNDQAIEQHLKSPHDNPAFMFGALGGAVAGISDAQDIAARKAQCLKDYP